MIRDDGSDVEYVPEESIINPNPVMYVAAAGLSPTSPVIEVVPVVEIPVFARITKLPAVPRDTGAGPVDVGVGVGVCADVDVGVGVCADVDVGVGVCADVDVGVGVCADVDVGVGVCADVDVGVCVAVDVGVDVEFVPPQADTSVMESIIIIVTTSPSMFLFFIWKPLPPDKLPATLRPG